MVESTNFVNLAKKLRKESTPWEVKLWAYLRGKKIKGLKFKRQVPMGAYIADFCCNEKKLIIELDGSQHKTEREFLYDQKRDNYFKNNGYKILRFNNNDLDTNIQGVLEVIQRVVIG